MKIEAKAQSLAELKKDLKNLLPIEVLIPGIAARGRFTLLSAREKIGKSTLMAHVAARLSQARPLFGKTVPECRILWVGLEEALPDAVQRFIAMDASDTHVFIVDDLGAHPRAQLRAELKAIKPDVCIVDSLSRYCVGMLDENSSAQLTKFLVPVSQMAREFNVAMVMLHHASKKAGFRGSTQIGAIPDMMIEMTADGTTETVRHLNAKGRFKLDNYSLAYDESAYQWSVVSRDAQDQQRRKQFAERCEKVEKFVRANAGAGKAAIRDAVGGKAVAVDKVIDWLVQKGTLENLGPRKGYSAVGC